VSDRVGSRLVIGGHAVVTHRAVDLFLKITGRYSLAKKRCEQILFVDPYNNGGA